MRRVLQLAAVLGLAAVAARADLYTWVDADGVTHVVDDPAAVPPDARVGREGLHDLWSEGPQGRMPVLASPRAGRVRQQTSRARRIVDGAASDIERGETARAAAALDSAIRIDPKLPDPHWYLAALDRERGRYAAAERHLRAFLGLAGEAYEPWRSAAQQRLRALVDEQRLADPASADPGDAWVGVAHPHFRIRYHEALGRAAPDYAGTVVRYLEEARRTVGERLGTVPAEPMGVVLYGKAAYLRAHRHRFSFQTVGFYDGRIHVVSAAHPAGELRALLFHEFAHAVFRERTGGDRPYWLNEGLAELCERASHGREGLTRSERSSLRQRIDSGSWIALRRIAPSFTGLRDDDARSAYLVSAAAARWIEDRTTPDDRAHLLQLLGEGRSDDDALSIVLGSATDGVDDEVRRWVRSTFPAAARP